MTPTHILVSIAELKKIDEETPLHVGNLKTRSDLLDRSPKVDLSAEGIREAVGVPESQEEIDKMSTASRCFMMGYIEHAKDLLNTKP